MSRPIWGGGALAAKGIISQGGARYPVQTTITFLTDNTKEGPGAVPTCRPAQD